MENAYKIVVSKMYYISHEEARQRKANDETERECAKRLALRNMEEDGRNGFLEPCEDNYNVSIS